MPQTDSPGQNMELNRQDLGRDHLENTAHAKDDAVLARLGKKPVLKVNHSGPRVPAWFHRLRKSEKFRVHGHLELRMYGNHHMGSVLVVSPGPNGIVSSGSITNLRY
jgi:hypothetical protein